MNICMAGIDYTTADIAEREAMSFTRSEASAFLARCMQSDEIKEAVLLVTCNRTELWLVGEGCPKVLLEERSGRSLFGLIQRREGEQAVLHLHRLACGLCSQVPGDEQIITQVRTAAEQAGPACGPVLSQLFKSAVTAGKRARTEAGAVKLPRSVAAAGIQKVEDQLGLSLQGKRALVIGSGNMGLLAVQHLLDRGAAVAVTMRKHRTTPPALPHEVEIIDYDDRYDYISRCDIAVGATSSPHPVLRYEPMSRALTGPLMILDIALPRDVEPAVAQLPNVTLLNLDGIGSPALDVNVLAIMEAAALKHCKDFANWLEVHELQPSMNALRGFAVKRMEKLEGLSSEQRRAVEEQTLNMLDTLLFRVKKQDGMDAFKTVSSALGKAAEEKGVAI